MTAASALLATVVVGSGGAEAEIADHVLERPPVEVIDGVLVYNAYVNHCDPSANAELPCPETNAKNRLRGFSWAGYEGGGVALPEAPIGLRIKASQLISLPRTKKIRRSLRVDTAVVPAGASSLPNGTGVLPNGKTIEAPFPTGAMVIEGTDQVVIPPPGTTMLPAFTKVRADGTAVLPSTIDAIAEANATVIQAALDEVPASAEAPAAVLLPPGEWFVAEGLTIGRSGVVLRGRGQGPLNRGTTLISVNVDRDEGGAAVLIRPPEPADGFPHPLRDLGNGRADDTLDAERYAVNSRISQKFVPSGTAVVRVADAGGFAVGDTVVVARTANQALVDASYPTPDARNGINPEPSSFDRGHERVIVKIRGNRLTLDRPLLDPIHRSMGGGDVTRIDPIPRLRQVGVEDLRIESDVEPYDEANDPETRKVKETHTRSGVELRHVEDAWVAGLTCRTLAKFCVGTMRYVKDVTVQDAAAVEWASMVTGGRRYAFHGGDGVGGSGVLFQRIYIEGARHPVVTGARVAGPVVWLDVESVGDFGDSGGHLGNSKGLLFDNLRAKSLQAWNKAPLLGKQGITGAQVVYWNSSNTPYGEAGRVNLASPAHAANFLVGGDIGPITSQGGAFIYRPNGPSSTMPRSLYLAELEDRMGPAAVAAVTTEAQRNGRIWEQLAAWRGDATPPPTG
ncbi:MAG: hypothetical protein AAGD35_18520 [Actinomycetota bacterium]